MNQLKLPAEEILPVREEFPPLYSALFQLLKALGHECAGAFVLSGEDSPAREAPGYRPLNEAGRINDLIIDALNTVAESTAEELGSATRLVAVKRAITKSNRAFAASLK